ncbi:MipA/OmpV family protein (plasmid) [Skermanella sp. TT6]|uniref:MipA/OmpV family protein n=1 Tax=Skermanella cutis TaxID=2775420 RepID=A0ABX7BGT5_9PROT|nr:MipA/OmpV family protein [Skermanella sp. TT6]QQP93294.1 MipA/OmpV family protein [Skermanella sp. TT6]
MFSAAGSAGAQESDKPLFEIGIGGGFGLVPDYPASEQSHVQGAALPFVIYRGDVLRASREGLQGRVYRSDRVTLEISLEGALGSSADDNDAREGMPDIDLLGEIGPGLRINLLRNADRTDRVDLTLPLRGVFSTDLSRVEYRGLVFAPDIAYAKYGLFDRDDRLRISVGPIFATSHLMDYYYQVDPRFARPGRPAYDAEAGYLGSRLQTSLTMPVTDRISVFGAFRGEVFSGSANEDSPLYKRDVNLSVGAGLTFSIYSSASRSTAAEGLLD